MDMSGAKEIFNISKFPVAVHWSFLLLAAFFVFPQFGDSTTQHIIALLWLPVIFIGILVHELGHALAIRKLGYGSSRILLWGMGGLCINGRRYNPRDGLKIVLAGPAAGALLGLPLFVVWLLGIDLGVIGNSLVYQWVFVNIGWSIFNVLPIFPLDGGRALFYGLRAYGNKTPDKAARTSGLVGLLVLAPLALLSLATKQFFMVIIIFMIGQTAWQAWRHGAGALRL